jgi:hypothetical protein
MEIDAKSVGLVVYPLPLKDVTVFVCNFTCAIDLVVLPLPLVNTGVGKCLNAFALSLAIDPLPSVSAARAEYDSREWFFVFSLNLGFDQLKKCVLF